MESQKARSYGRELWSEGVGAGWGNRPQIRKIQRCEKHESPRRGAKRPEEPAGSDSQTERDCHCVFAADQVRHPTEQRANRSVRDTVDDQCGRERRPSEEYDSVTNVEVLRDRPDLGCCHQGAGGGAKKGAHPLGWAPSLD